MRLRTQEEILYLNVRKQIIDEIKNGENQERKREAYKRYLCYKDQTKKFVVEQLQKQFDSSTVEEMAYCISNISIARKIIDKLARVYNYGVEREVEGSDADAANILKLEKELNFNTSIRAANKFLKLQKNLAFYIKPCPVIQNDGSEKYTIKLEPMNPYLYDVVEDYYDRTKPLCYILSDFDYCPSYYAVGDAANAGRTATFGFPVTQTNSNKEDEKIADDPADAKLLKFIWWTDKYHFTTDGTGEITSDYIDNPIEEMPFENFAIEQDGQFWAIGGDDLIDGSILLNSVMTNNQHVATTQGFGQFWMSGKNLPTGVKIGPTKMIRMEYQQDEPVPAIGFESANPQIAEMRDLVETYVALLLTTNNLSTSAVSSSLNGSTATPSGIAMVIDKAESMEDVNDQRQIFIDKEPCIWRKINKWLKVYGDELIDSLKGLELSDDFWKKFSLDFTDAPVISSEKEKLENLKLRKDLGIDSMIDLIKMDNPQLDDGQAEKKLADVLEEKMKHQMDAQKVMADNSAASEGVPPNENNQDGSNGQQDSVVN